MKKYTEGGALLGMFMPIPSVAVTQSRATVHLLLTTSALGIPHLDISFQVVFLLLSHPSQNKVQNSKMPL